MALVFTPLALLLRPLLNIFNEYDDDDYDKSYGYTSERGVDPIYLILGFFALGIWLVFKRYKNVQNRPIEFTWPAPEVSLLFRLNFNYSEYITT